MQHLWNTIKQITIKWGMPVYQCQVKFLDKNGTSKQFKLRSTLKPCLPVQSESRIHTRRPGEGWALRQSPDVAARACMHFMLCIHAACEEWIMTRSNLRNAARMPDMERRVQGLGVAASSVAWRSHPAPLPAVALGRDITEALPASLFLICKVTFLEGITLPQRNSEKIWWICGIIHMPNKLLIKPHKQLRNCSYVCYMFMVSQTDPNSFESWWSIGIVLTMSVNT